MKFTGADNTVEATWGVGSDCTASQDQTELTTVSYMRVIGMAMGGQL